MVRSRVKWALKAAGMIAALTFIVGIASITVDAKEYQNGAYIVPITVTYANPLTGEIADGGSNEALGDSMSQSVMESIALVEIWEDETYVTLGFGLASNIGETKVLLQGENTGNEFVSAELHYTGSCERDGDICNHYRFQMSNAKELISPVLYVTPMGREVQFYIQLNLEELTEGTGNYISEIVSEKQLGEVSASQTEEAQTEAAGAIGENVESETPVASSKSLKIEELKGAEEFGSEKEISAEQSEETEVKKDKNEAPIIAVAVIGTIIIVGTAAVVLKKRR